MNSATIDAILDAVDDLSERVIVALQLRGAGLMTQHRLYQELPFAQFEPHPAGCECRDILNLDDIPIAVPDGMTEEEWDKDPYVRGQRAAREMIQMALNGDTRPLVING